MILVVLGEDEWREGHRVSLLGLGRHVGHRWVIVGMEYGPEAPHGCMGSLGLVGSLLGHRWDGVWS